MLYRVVWWILRDVPEDIHLRSVPSSFVLFYSFCLLYDDFLSILYHPVSSQRSPSFFFLCIFMAESASVFFSLQNEKVVFCAVLVVYFPIMKSQSEFHFIFYGNGWLFAPQLCWTTLSMVWGNKIVSFRGIYLFSVIHVPVCILAGYRNNLSQYRLFEGL